MLNSGKKNRTLRDIKYKYYNSCEIRKQISERNIKPKPAPPPFPPSSYMVGPLAHVVLIGGKPSEPFVYFALCLVVIFLKSAVEISNRLLRMYTNSHFTPSLNLLD